MPCELRVLGPPAVVAADGTPLDLPLGKPFAALCYVALERTSVGREDLAHVLWPDSAERRARASVRQALWLLRATLGEDVLVEDAGTLELDTDRIRLDLDRFETHLAGGRLDDAWGMWGPGPLDGFSVPDAPHWEAWAHRFREQLSRRFGEALETRALSLEGDARLEWLERALRVRPYLDRLHAARVEALVAAHRVEDAEAALHDLRRQVDDPPPGLIDELERKVRALSLATTESGPEAPRLEFVGRSREFAALAAHWRSAKSGRPRLAAILGPAGIGKTRLADELVALAGAEGTRLAGTKGVDLERDLRLAGLVTLVKSLLVLPGAAGVSARTMQAFAPLVPSLADVPVQGRATVPSGAVLADALLDLVEAVAHEGPLILRVEDLQWIDATSRTLILRAFRGLQRAPVLLLVTCRTTDADRSADRVLRELGARGQASLLPLEPLTAAHVTEMLGLMFAFPSADEIDTVARRLHGASGGNPLFLNELLRSLEERGLVRTRTGLGEEVARTVELPAELRLPRTVREALERRIEDLGEGAERVATALALAAGALEPDEISRRTGLSLDEIDDAVAELTRKDVTRREPGDRLSLSHDTIREILRGRARPVRRVRRLIRRRAGWAAALVVPALLVAGWIVSRSGAEAGSDPGLYGGGIIWVERPGQVAGYRLSPGSDGGIEVRKTDSLLLPEGVAVRTAPTPDGDGGWSAAGVLHPSLEEAPDAVIVGRGGARIVYETSGDDIAVALAPDGRRLLLAVEDPNGPPYRLHLVRYDPLTGDTAVLATGATTNTYWTPTGERIVARLTRRPDSVVVMWPDGTVEARAGAVYRRMDQLEWCAPLGSAVWFDTPPGEAAEGWIWTPGGDPARLALEYVPAGRIVCSPDGSAFLYRGIVGAERRLVLHERATGSGRVLPVPFGDVTGWVPPSRPSAPRSVEIQLDSLRLSRGERRRLVAEVEGVVDSLKPERVVWGSADPLVASVSDDGTVTANGPGRTSITVTVDRWLRDSLTVRVAPQPGAPDVLFSDRLADLDQDRWYVVGYPAPAPTTDSRGEPVLDMRGDGRYRDGIVSRASFDLRRGATAMVDFRLPLRDRRDRQKMEFCLLDAEPGPRVRDYATWVVPETLCFEWPAEELVRFDPSEARFEARALPVGPIPIADHLDPDGWNRVAIQVRPDGTTSLHLNEAWVYTYPVRIGLEGRRWRLGIFSRAVDTEHWVRNVALWRGQRYEVPPAG
ncbi:MAG: AAA family ATPase [Gemmatimonadota bacterium]